MEELKNIDKEGREVKTKLGEGGSIESDLRRKIRLNKKLRTNYMTILFIVIVLLFCPTLFIIIDII